ncbi:hypothetical protein AB0B39_22580 [Micromonospora sp. NPDC049114]|uniref:hypothetical protein n=1 Tax=Micromonospora sp. NPDC049114 TaxID=3155498 RepID=UPI0033FB3835
MGDFDFYVGTWNVVNRRLRERLTGCDEWEEFPGVSVAHSFFGGGGNFDEITFPTKVSPAPRSGSSTRRAGSGRSTG